MPKTKKIKKDFKHYKKWFLKLHPLAGAWIFYGICAFLDWASTEFVKSQHIAEVIEENAFVRGADFQIVWYKALINELLYGFAAILVVMFIYKLFHKLYEPLAVVMAGAPLVFFSSYRLLDAIVPNILYGLHFYVSTEQIIKMLGGS